MMTEPGDAPEAGKHDSRQARWRRNARLYDVWSNVHILSGIMLGWTLPPLVAFILAALYEPFEVFVLSPLLMKRGIVFGYEALPNSLSDIFFDALGIVIGYFFATHVGRPQDIFLLFR